MLIAPKLLAFVLLLTDADTRRKFGGGLLVLAGIIAETILSGLTAPVMMIFQSSAVGEILFGRDAGWQVQRRDDGAVSHRDTVNTYAVPTLVGIVMAVAAYAVSLPLLLWMTPVILGLLLSIPIAILSSSGSTRRSGLFKTPEQTAPPPVLTRANELGNAPHSPLACPLQELRRDAALLEAHLNNLSGRRPRKRGEVDPHLAIARAKIEDAETFKEAVGFLSAREKFAVLKSPAVLAVLLALPDPV
jgi:membrane glycosyltransferase